MGIYPNPASRYQLEFDERKDYLYAHVKSNRSDTAVTREYIIEITDRLAAGRGSKLMIEKGNPTALWFWDAVTINDVLSSPDSAVKMVAVVDPSLSHLDRDDFGVVIGKTLSPQIHFFKNASTAAKWLSRD